MMSAVALSDDPFARISTKEPAALRAAHRRIPSILSNLREPGWAQKRCAGWVQVHGTARQLFLWPV